MNVNDFLLLAQCYFNTKPINKTRRPSGYQKLLCTLSQTTERWHCCSCDKLNLLRRLLRRSKVKTSMKKTKTEGALLEAKHPKSGVIFYLWSQRASIYFIFRGFSNCFVCPLRVRSYEFAIMRRSQMVITGTKGQSRSERPTAESRILHHSQTNCHIVPSVQYLPESSLQQTHSCGYIHTHLFSNLPTAAKKRR